MLISMRAIGSPLFILYFILMNKEQLIQLAYDVWASGKTSDELVHHLAVELNQRLDLWIDIPTIYQVDWHGKDLVIMETTSNKSSPKLTFAPNRLHIKHADCYKLDRDVCINMYKEYKNRYWDRTFRWELGRSRLWEKIFKLKDYSGNITMKFLLDWEFISSYTNETS